MTGRAQSNTLGFVLLFAVVLASIGAVATAGVDSLESGRETATVQSVGQSFQALAEAGTDIHRENVSVRTTQMRLGNGALKPGDNITMTIEDSSGPVSVGGTAIDSMEITPLVYELDDRQVVYSGTAVMRQQPGGGSSVVRRPDFRLDQDVVIIPVVQTSVVDPSGNPNPSLSGGEAQVYLTRVHSSTTTAYSGTTDLTITVDPPAGRLDAWHDALESVAGSGWSCPDPSGGEIECEATGSSPTVIIRHISVDFEIAG